MHWIFCWPDTLLREGRMFTLQRKKLLYYVSSYIPMFDLRGSSQCTKYILYFSRIIISNISKNLCISIIPENPLKSCVLRSSSMKIDECEST